jgi:flagellar motility protein MotE (MotC chaperone)
MNDFMKQFWEKFRLLPLLVVVASLAFLIRVGEASLQVRQLSGSANAQVVADDKAKDQPTETSDKKPDDTKTDRPKDTTKKPEIDLPSTDTAMKDAEPAKEGAAKDAQVDPKKDLAKTPKTDWKDASDNDIDYSAVRQDVYKDLLQRRQQLDAREKELKKREALIAATNTEISGKVKELTTLKTEIEKLMKKQTDEEQENVTRLVRIYEGMKPKDAARIFNALDMDVLVSVLGKMGEKKSGAIIAAMDAEKARTVTLMLSEQKKLPDLNMGSGDSASSDQMDPVDLPALGQERDQSDAEQPPPAPPLTNDTQSDAQPPA